jgi:hypothetical protein
MNSFACSVALLLAVGAYAGEPRWQHLSSSLVIYQSPAHLPNKPAQWLLISIKTEPTISYSAFAKSRPRWSGIATPAPGGAASSSRRISSRLKQGVLFMMSMVMEISTSSSVAIGKATKCGGGKILIHNSIPQFRGNATSSKKAEPLSTTTRFLAIFSELANLNWHLEPGREKDFPRRNSCRSAKCRRLALDCNFFRRGRRSRQNHF